MMLLRDVVEGDDMVACLVQSIALAHLEDFQEVDDDATCGRRCID